PPPSRDLSVYKGLGTWVDAYDFSPQYQPNNNPPPVTPESVDQMVGQGVRTVYLQAAKDDTRSPGELVNPEILGPMLARAHAHGIKVVAWYLPKFYDLDSDVRRLRADLGLPAAPVHPAGGTDHRSTDEDYRGFVRACAEEHAMGGSIYDWRTTPPQAWGILRAVRY